MDLFGGLAAVPVGAQQPQPVDQASDQAEHQHHLQVQAGQELLHLVHPEQQRVAGYILPGDQIHHADGLARQLQLYCAHHVALLDGRADVVRQMEVFLGDGAVAGGGQQGHHAVVGVQLQGVGVGGISDRDLRNGQISVQRSLNGKAVEYPVHQFDRLEQGGAAVGVAKGIAAVRAVHHAEDIGGTVLVAP